MRKFGLVVALVVMSAGVAFGRSLAAVPITLVAKATLYRTKPSVWLTWTDTNAVAVQRTEVRRRSTGSDTLWKALGATYGKLAQMNDVSVLRSKTYRYQVRDSVAGSALTPWSDSVSVTVP
jgi:hypothetical protein